MVAGVVPVTLVISPAVMDMASLKCNVAERLSLVMYWLFASVAVTPVTFVSVGCVVSSVKVMGPDVPMTAPFELYSCASAV